MFIIRTRTWLVVVAVFFGLSVAAVSVHSLPYPYVPRSLRDLCEQFASPGELLWFATLGGAFAGYPSDLPGYVVWVLGTTVFWIFVAVACVALGKAVYSAVHHFHQ